MIIAWAWPVLLVHVSLLVLNGRNFAKSSIFMYLIYMYSLLPEKLPGDFRCGVSLFIVLLVIHKLELGKIDLKC